jgi:hypothetical protein
VQPHPPAEAVCGSDPGELNTESCFWTELLEHFGQLTVALLLKTSSSNLWAQLWQLYSNIGINPRGCLLNQKSA